MFAYLKIKVPEPLTDIGALMLSFPEPVMAYKVNVCAVGTVTAWLTLMSPTALTSRLPAVLMVPSWMPSASRKLMLLAPVLLTDTVPPKLLLEDGRLMALAPAVMPVVPVTVSVPAVWLTAPAAVKFPPTATLPLLWLKAPICRLFATCSVPLVMVSAPVLGVLILSSATVPACATPTTVALSKVTVAPLGITTLATLAWSGTAPPVQLPGVSQLFVLAPPVHVTEFRRVMLPVRPLGRLAGSIE